MFGPRLQIETEHSALLLRGIEPQDLQTLPPRADAAITEYLSLDTQREIADLFRKRENSDEYLWWKTGRDRVVWGIFNCQDTVERLVGHTGFSGYTPSREARGWYEAESYSILFEPEHMGRGIATATHPYRTACAFTMGLNCLRSSVVVGNERSARAVLGAGYALLGTDYPDAEGRERYEFRQYNPKDGAIATVSALAVTNGLAIHSLDVTAVSLSQQHVARCMQTLPTAVEATKTWMDEHGSQLIYLPTEVPATET